MQELAAAMCGQLLARHLQSQLRVFAFLGSVLAGHIC